ncbi:MAG: dipicolinate synthase subunit DpsA [Oscillospiraceae bacterium]|nr:dipicolinate synthase subunit DpsA [Oscillospiraceae bacterium]
MDIVSYPLTFLLIGGDLRQARLAKLLAGRGHDVIVTGMDGLDIHCEELSHAAIAAADWVILPLPVRSGKNVNAPLSEKPIALKPLLDALRPGQKVLGGLADSELLEEMERRKIRFYDYFARDEVAVLNSIATAEGAIAIAMEETPYTLFGANCIVTGYGRVGAALARRLGALGAKVTVAVRSHTSMAKAKEAGCGVLALKDLSLALSGADLVFNTIPARIFDAATLEKAGKNTLFIDLASKPGGMDFQAAGEMGIRAVWALSLPGKVAPQSSGDIIFGAVKNLLEETGVMI